MITVVLTSYNHAQFIRETLESITNQTISPKKIVIFDDASTDGSQEIIKDFKKNNKDKFEFELILNVKNQRTGVLRRIFNETDITTPYVAIHHSDDVWHKEKLEKQVRFLQSHLAVFTNVELIDENNNLLNSNNIFNQHDRNRHQLFKDLIATGNFLAHPSAILDYTLFKKINYTNKYSQLGDYHMWLQILTYGEIKILDEALTKFRIHGKNVSRPSTEVNKIGDFEDFQIKKEYLSYKYKDFLIKCYPELDKINSKDEFQFNYNLGKIIIKKFNENSNYSINFLKVGLDILHSCMDNTKEIFIYEDEIRRLLHENKKKII